MLVNSFYKKLENKIVTIFRNNKISSLDLLKILCILNLIFWPSFSAFSAEQYTIDKTHSSIEFTVTHLMISKINGHFTNFTGIINYEDNDITKSSVNVIAKANSVDTEDKDRDNHLKSSEFLDVNKFPEISFQSKKIKHKGRLNLCVGILTLHGVSKEIAIPFSITGKVKDPSGKIRIAAEGSTTINRQDFGVSWNKAMDLGGTVVGDEVKINLFVEAVKN